jgi:hypothetical protein
MNAATCPKCGASLQIIPEPHNDPLSALKDDLEEFVQQTAPGDADLARQQISNWRPTVGEGPQEIVSSAEEAEPVAVYDAPDETSARLVASLLETEGIDVMVEQHTVPMLETSQQLLEGVWGQVYVHRQDLALATQVIQAYEGEEALPQSG